MKKTQILMMALTLQPNLAKDVMHCQVENPKKHVWIFKQWHLSPNVDTKKDPARKEPQSENQTALYRQLNEWISKKQISTVLAEGCSGSIANGFALKFNGWTLKDLQVRASDKDYVGIVTHVPMKLEAKYGDKINTVCADDDALIKQQNLAFSDARGTLGYYSRLTQYKNDPARAKPYLEDVIKLYKLAPTATTAEGLSKLQSEFRESIVKVKSTIDARNHKMVEIIKGLPAQEMAFVVGGIHAEGLAKLLEQAGVGCTVAEPTGYAADAEKSITDLEKMSQNLPK